MTTISNDLWNFIKCLPKAELHVHLEGTISPETALTLASRNGINYPYKSIEEINYALNNRTAGLESFLDTHYTLNKVLRTKEDFNQLTYNFLNTCKLNNVLYVEIKFDPQPQLEQRLSFEELLAGINSGRKNGLKDFGVESNLIMCIQRDRTIESAWKMIDEAYSFRHLISGLGLDSYEKNNPPNKYQEIYATARKQGYNLTAHCDVDQENSLQHIWECIDDLKTTRIDHGLNCIEDQELVNELIKRNITLTTYVPLGGVHIKDLETLEE